ncbi:MAG TPA: hypothetical protein VFZ80_00790 [Acidimicrobiia bacterium]
MEMRPKAFGENLNEWFRGLGQTWKPMLVLCAIVFVPLGILTTALILIPGALDSYFDLIDPNLDLQTPAELLELLGPLLWVGAIWAVLQLVATVLVYIAAGRVIAVRSVGSEATARELLRFAGRRLGTGLGAGLMLALGLLAILAAAVLVGWAVLSGGGANFLTIFLTAVVALTALVICVWLGVGVSLYPQAIAMDAVNAPRSLVASFRLVKTRWWPTLGFELVAGLIVSAVAQVLSFVLVPILFLGMVAPVFLAVGYGLATMLQGPVAASIGLAYAVWYVDLRAREQPMRGEDLV